MSQKQLTPDIVGKVIRADLKNIIDKVGSGRPLSGVERGIFDTLNLTGEDLTQKRQLSLLSKWANGKRLNKSELQEIGELLPEDTISDDTEDTTDPPERKRGRNGFYHLYPHYEKIYGKSVRTLKRYVADGKDCNDPIDLDDPEQMYAWWSRNMTAKCPDGILQALVLQRKENPVATKPAEVPEPEQSADPELPEEIAVAEPTIENPPEDNTPVSEAEKGMQALLERLEEIEVKLSRKATAPGQAKPWLDTVSRMTVVTSKVREELTEQGKLIPRDMAEMILRGFHGPIEQAVRAMYSEFCNATGIAKSPANEQRWKLVCDKIFERLAGEVFGEV